VCVCARAPKDNEHGDERLELEAVIESLTRHSQKSAPEHKLCPVFTMSHYYREYLFSSFKLKILRRVLIECGNLLVARGTHIHTHTHTHTKT
jgi:hypothetical protein